MGHSATGREQHSCGLGTVELFFDDVIKIANWRNGTPSHSVELDGLVWLPSYSMHANHKAGGSHSRLEEKPNPQTAHV